MLLVSYQAAVVRVAMVVTRGALDMVMTPPPAVRYSSPRVALLPSKLRCRAPIVCVASSALEPEEPPEHLRTVDGFYNGAEALRKTFDEHFASPRQAHAMRFVWDYWHVPGQYTLHRTQAADYFGPEAFEALTSALTAYGQRELGCRAISPPWLSYYIDGCEQAMHADVPQGPFAYVLSLTRWEERQFEGGETMLLRPRVLDFWRGFDSSEGLELGDLFSLTPPLFNQLTVFDARIPHGVRRVDGTRDPRGGRLVLHGWFTEPSPYFEGGLPEAQIEAGLADTLGPIFDAISPPAVTGLLSVRLRLSAGGDVKELSRLADTLVVDPSQLQAGADADAERGRVVRIIRDGLLPAKFPTSDEETLITIPFVFD
jgi:hypothetical protein